jgi:hypothetical protein
MYLSRGEYTQFSLKGRLNLIDEFGVLVNEKHVREIDIKIYHLYDFYVEVLYKNQNVIKAEPVMFPGLLNYFA